MYACTRPTDSHKERSPSGQCAAISIPRGGKLSQAKRERCLWNRHALSFSSFLSSLSRYRSYRDCFRERSTRERGQRCSSRVLLPRCSSTFVYLSPSATESTSSIDRSRKIDFTKRNALWFHRSNEGEGGGILSCRSDEFLSFSSLPLLSIRSPLRCHERDHEGVAIATSNSIRPPFPSTSRRGDSLSSRPSSSFDCLCPASGLASGSRQRLH